MIYILGESFFNGYNDLEDVVYMASTKIDDILEYTYNNIDLDCYNNFTILVKEDGDLSGDLSYGIISVDQYSYANIMSYTPYMFLKDENKNEYEHVKNQLRIWRDKIAEKKKKEQEERDRLEKERKEREERELYEKLKAKYGD
jgi:hypothetical protein